MKYIRTKDNIYEIENTFKYLGKTYYDVKECNFTYSEEEIIKQANAIEDLCDEFVAVGVPFKPFVIEKSLYEEQGNTLEEYVHYLYIQYTNVVVYGAIWTDKGLIYVAKMNDGGELELL